MDHTETTFDIAGAKITIKTESLFKAWMAQAIALPEKLPAAGKSQPRIGVAWIGQGGVYAGIIRGENGNPDYHLIVAPAGHGEIAEITWGQSDSIAGAQSDIDGLANTHALIAAQTAHPAASWATRLVIDGHNDYYLPARKELRLLHVNTPEGFDTDGWYWSSTQNAANPGYAWLQHFTHGNQNYYHKSNECRARAVRRLLIIE